MISIPICNLYCEKSKVSNFLDVTVSTKNKKFETDLYCKLTGCHQFLKLNILHPFHSKKSIIIAKGYVFKGYIPSHKKVKNILKVYALSLTTTVIQRNLLKIKLEGFAKANQSSYLNVALRLRLVYNLLLRIILDFII